LANKGKKIPKKKFANSRRYAGPHFAIGISCPVAVDIFTQDPVWLHWSAGNLAEHAESDILVINPSIYAEVSCHFSSKELD
jgi:hypothetical protein